MSAREQHLAGKLPKAELTRIEDDSIREAVAMQERVGVGAITDGEYRKRGWREFLYDKCDGFGPETSSAPFRIRLYDGTTAPPIRKPKVTSKLKRREPLSAEDFSALKTMTRRPIKANLPTSSVANFFTGDAVLDRAAYGNRVELMDDLARIMREEIADLAARGCTYLQMDEVPLAVIRDRNNMEVVRSRGDDPNELIDLYLDAINNSIGERPTNMTVCVHLCRGNYAQGMADGGYEPIAERMFDQLDVDGYFLEYDTPRAGDFKSASPSAETEESGTRSVSTKLPELESADALKRRVDEATKFIDLERLCLSPQCGFASVPTRVRQTFAMDLTERKLARVVEVAHEVWG